MQFDQAGFCFVRDMIITGNVASASGSGIVFKKASSCVVDTCRISRFAESGIRFEGTRDGQLSSNTVRNCHFIGNAKAQLYSVFNNDFFIIGNQFGTHGVTPLVGCVLDHSSAGTYSMNYHWSNVNALVLGPGAHYNRIANNRFEMSRETGLIIGRAKGDSCVFNIITGNTFHTNSESRSGAFPAVRADNSSQTTFCQNQVFSWNSAKTKHKSSLILESGCSAWIIKDNNFRHNVEADIVYDPDAGHIVKDNLTD